jgi:hypothetical protein
MPPRSPTIVGSAVETIVWSSEASSSEHQRADDQHDSLGRLLPTPHGHAGDPASAPYGRAAARSGRRGTQERQLRRAGESGIAPIFGLMGAVTAPMPRRTRGHSVRACHPLPTQD